MRLNACHRERLKNYALELTENMFPLTKIDKLRESLSAWTREVLLIRYPHQEMLILQRHESASDHTTAKIVCPDEDCRTTIIKLQPSILLPSTVYRANHVTPTIATKPYRDNHELIKLEKEREEAIRLKVKKYYALIDSASTFETLIEVWPEAKILMPDPEIPRSRALSVVTPDVVEEIQRDVALRAKKQKA